MSLPIKSSSPFKLDTNISTSKGSFMIEKD